MYEEDYDWWEREMHTPVSLCNFCTLQDLYERAAQESKWLTLKDHNGWTSAHIHNLNQPLSDATFRASFMELTEHCVC